MKLEQAARRPGGRRVLNLCLALAFLLTLIGLTPDAKAQAVTLAPSSPTAVTAIPGTVVTLQVAFTCADCSPGSPVTVSWTLTGAGLVTPATQDLTFQALDQVIVAQTQLRLTTATGVRTVVSRVVGGAGTPVTFTINAIGIDPTTASHRVQAALGIHSAMANTGLTGTTLQLSNIQNRLRDRRGGAGGLSLYGASFLDRGLTLSGSAMQSLLDRFAETDSKNMPMDAFGRLGVFVNGQGSFGSKDKTAAETGYRSKAGGLTIGADYRITDRLIAGAAVGFLRTKSDFDAALGQNKTKGVGFSLFGTYYHKNGYYIDSIAHMGWNGYDSDRNIAENGAIASASTNGSQRALSITNGYEINNGALVFGPYVRASYIRVKVNEFGESGAGDFDVHTDAQSLTSLTSDLGLQLSYAISTSWGVLSPNARLEWEHQFKNNSRLLTGSLVVDPFQQTFAVATDEPDRNYFNLGLGLAAQFAHGRSAFVSYEAVLGRSAVTNNSVTAGLRLEF